MLADPLWLLALLCAAIACAGVVQVVVGAILVRRFAVATRVGFVPPIESVTVLKPLYGAEPLLEEALESLCRQRHVALQIVCGVQDASDPAIAVVRRIMDRFPHRDIALVIDTTQHGRNRKIGNLINMVAAARHDVLVLADSDVHMSADAIGRMLAALAQPKVGVVTAPYSGAPASDDLVALLGASGISHGFLPGALMARALGRRDCLGAAMMLRRSTLDAIGGLRALSPHLADDHMLGLLVRRHGLEVAMASCVPSTTVPETRLRDLFRHELRWSRTIASLAPLGFVASVIQYPIAWATLSCVLAGFGVSSVGLLLAAWFVRAIGAVAIDRMLGLPSHRAAIWLLPLRDALSLSVAFATFVGTEVEWRGQIMHVRPQPRRGRRLTPLDTLPLGTEP